MSRRFAFVAIAAVLVFAACSDDDDTASKATSTTSTSAATTAGSEPARATHVLHGRATLDGSALDTKFLDAVVRDHGLITPCQATIPPVSRGQYEIGVLTAPSDAGCGRAGAEVLLWIYIGTQKVFSNAAIPWPDGDAAFDVAFSSAKPLGAATPITEFNGVVRRNGDGVPVGTLVEAFVDGTRCGVASVRSADSFTGYILNVVDESAVPGCRAGAPLSFRIDGKPAAQTSINAPDHSGPLDLTVSAGG